jgi:hypothetical protein
MDCVSLFSDDFGWLTAFRSRRASIHSQILDCMLLRRFLFACLFLLCAAPLTLLGQTFMNFTIQQPAPPAAGFTYLQNNLTYDFSDISGGTITEWHWDFGNGDTSVAQNPVYTFGGSGTFIVCLTVLDANHCSATTCDTILAVGVAPEHLRWLSLQPNPFIGTTQLSYALTHAADVRIGVYSLQGALVEEVVGETQTAGNHAYVIGAHLAQGSYFVTVVVDGQATARKMIKVH